MYRRIFIKRDDERINIMIRLWIHIFENLFKQTEAWRKLVLLNIIEITVLRLFYELHLKIFYKCIKIRSLIVTLNIQIDKV